MRKPGEFQKKRAMHQRQARIYATLRAACARAQRDGTAQVDVDCRRFYLAGAEGAGTSGLVFMRWKKLGIVCAYLNEKGQGYAHVYWPKQFLVCGMHSFAWRSVLAYVTRVEDLRTGADAEIP